MDLFLNHYFRAHKALGSKDRSFISETLYGIVRWQGLLRALSKQTPSWRDLITLYLSHSIDDLRSREGLAPWDAVSMPKWLYNLLQENYGEERAIALALESNRQAPSCIRTNLLKCSREELLERLQDRIPSHPSPVAPAGILFEKRSNYFSLPEYKEGLFEVQDEGSQLLSDLVEAKPGDHLLDYCAGAGGKTLAIATAMEGKGQIYLHDVRPQALAEAKLRCRRASVQNAQFLPSGDRRLKALKGKCDWVLVDAPCSGTGTLRRNPGMKWRLNEQELTKLILLQRTIFASALEYLAPKGCIVYATCSILRCENQEQADYFCKEFHLKAEEPCFQTFPTSGGPDGFFGQRFRIFD